MQHALLFKPRQHIGVVDESEGCWDFKDPALIIFLHLGAKTVSPALLIKFQPHLWTDNVDVFTSIIDYQIVPKGLSKVVFKS